MTDRYQRQVRLVEIGAAGQARIRAATVCIIGCGGLGSTSAEILVRAGVGRLRIADRDFVDITNLQRQVLFDEQDAAQKLPKAEAAAKKLRAVNSSVEIEPLVADIVPRNIAALIEGATIVVDGTDNLETRYLINDACVSASIPWIYGGVVGMSGLVMPVVPGKSPCLRCMLPNPPLPGTFPTCETEGVLASAPLITASLQAACALKLIVGDESGLGQLTRIDVWRRSFSTVTILKDDTCPACAGRCLESTP